jgi:hypothetical protein
MSLWLVVCATTGVRCEHGAGITILDAGLRAMRAILLWNPVLLTFVRRKVAFPSHLLRELSASAVSAGTLRSTICKPSGG